MPLLRKVRLIFFGGMAIVAFSLAAQTVHACSNPSPMPGGFALPCPVLGVTPTSTAPSGSVTVTATPGANQYVNQQFYLYNGSAWTSYQFQGSFTRGYTSNTANYTLTSSQLSQLPQGTIYLAEWDWTYSAAQKCFMGPSSTVCNQGYWRVQAFTITQGGGGGGGGDNAYCRPGDVAQFGSTDGPAQLPQNCIYTAMSATPSPGSVIFVSATGSIQTAVNNASCGQTIQLQAGASWDAAGLTLPAKNCDSNHWITIETSAYSQLPLEGTRISPCWAGVASLPGRQSYACPSGGPENVMAQIVVSNTSNNINVEGDHYRLIGLEITRTIGTPTGQNGLISQLVTNLAASGPPTNHIIFDRLWIHGDVMDDSGSGISLNGGNHIAVIDSYMNDFHCTGYCTDAHTMGGGVNSLPTDGAWKIVDNYLEASGETILFGGGASSYTPADIEIRRNFMYKPLIWNPWDPSYMGSSTDGNAFLVKNLFETKNSQRDLLEGNRLENVWGGFSQSGSVFVITPRNQNVKGVGVCPLCEDVDLTIRYNYASHSGPGFEIANQVNVNANQMIYPLAGNHYSFHDNVFDDMDYATCHGCGGHSGEIFTGFTPMPPNSIILHDVSINHITYVNPLMTGLLTMGSASTTQMWNISYTNNITQAAPDGIWSTGGGSDNCAYPPGNPSLVWNACVTPSTNSFTNNVVVGGTTFNNKTFTWPSGNYPSSTDFSGVGFMNFNNGIGGDYHLTANSPYKNAGSDGQDVGANIDLVNQYTSGVVSGTPGS